MELKDAPNWLYVKAYVDSIISGKKIACKMLKLACERFYRDLQNPNYDFEPKNAELVIAIIEQTFTHRQGETIDGIPLRGKPFKLEPYHKFIIYNLLGFYLEDKKITRFHEALIFIPRKNIKTTFAGALAHALGVLYRKSGTKIYIVSAGLPQSLESWNFMRENVECATDSDRYRIINNNNEHSITATFEDGAYYCRAMADNPDAQDTLN